MIVLMIFLSQYFSLRCWLAAMLTRLGYSALCSTAGPCPGEALPGHCWLLIGWLVPSRPLIGPWLSFTVHSAPLTSAGAGDTRLADWVREGPALSSGRGSGQPGLDTQLRDNNLAEWPNAHNFSIN